MAEQPTRQVRNRAFGAILANAIVRWESLVTVAMTGILFFAAPQPFPWWQPWFWLVAGGVAEAALILSHLTDPAEAQRAVAREFEQKFDLNAIRKETSRERVARAIDYRRNMLTLVDRHSGAMRAQLAQTTADVSDWIAQMYDLALHIDAFEGNDLVKRDLKHVPFLLEQARGRYAQERDPSVRASLEEQIRQLEIQLQNLQATANSVERAKIQLDSTLSSLGTIYAQMSLLGTKEVDSARAQRLRAEVKDEISSLQDTIGALDEVQSQRLQLR